MLIGVDAGCLGVKDERLKVGIYIYTSELLINLARIDKKNEYLLYSFDPIDKRLMKKLEKRMKNIVVKPTKGWIKIWLPLRISIDKPDVFISFGQSLPKVSQEIKVLGVFYDLAFELFPNLFEERVSEMSEGSRSLARRSDHIVAISKSTKADLSRVYEIYTRKISVIYPGIRKLRSSKTKDNNEYFLFVGALRKLKNIEGLLKAFSKFQEANSDCKLYIVGGDRWISEEILNSFKILDTRVRRKIKLTGFAKDDKLASYYKKSIALIHPSFYEGFGFSVVEAMSLGCPVIVSKNSSLLEVVGEAGIKVSPNEHSKIAEAMSKLFYDRNLRKKYSILGKKRAADFSWDKSAREFLQVIESFR